MSETLTFTLKDEYLASRLSPSQVSLLISIPDDRLFAMAEIKRANALSISALITRNLTVQPNIDCPDLISPATRFLHKITLLGKSVRAAVIFHELNVLSGARAMTTRKVIRERYAYSLLPPEDALVPEPHLKLSRHRTFYPKA